MSTTLRLLSAMVGGLAVLSLACSEDTPVSSGPLPDAAPLPYLAFGGGADEQGVIAQRTGDDGYLIVGLIGKPFQFFNDLYAVRVGNDGAILGRYPVRRGDVSWSILAAKPAADGGVVAVVVRDGETFLFKFAQDGSIAWERDYGSFTGPVWYSLCTAGDGFLIVVVPDLLAELTTNQFIFTNADGTLESTETWAAGTRRVYTAAEAGDGAFYLAGLEWATPTDPDAFVERTQSGGVDKDWVEVFRTENNDYALLATALGNDAVVFAILDEPPGPPLESGYEVLMRLRSNGREAWTSAIAELGYVYGMTPTGDGDIAVAANGPGSSANIARVRGTGSVVWRRGVGTDPERTTLLSITADDDGLVATGVMRDADTDDLDILLVSTDGEGDGISFPPHEPECIDPVTPPPPSGVVGTQRSFSVVHDTDIGMEAVWALSPDFVVAVGDSGHIARFNGTAWSQMNSNTREELYDVYGFSEDDVFVAARHGKIFHYDGSSWSEMPSTATYLGALWGAAPDDVWAGGVQLMHYDGDRWEDVTPKGWSTPIDMDGITATDIYSVGAAGLVQHFDGCTWTTVHQAPDRLLGVSANPGPLVYCVGDDGLVVRYTGDAWQTIGLPSGDDFTSVWARSAGDVFVAGTSGFTGPYVLHWFDGTTWASQVQASTHALLDVTGTDGGYVFGATSYGDIVRGSP